MRLEALSMVCALACTCCMVDLETPSVALITCSAASECPAGRVCLVSVGTCVDERDECVERGESTFTAKPDGSACSRLDGGGAGVCDSGVCGPVRCGDGVLDDARGEECDDGNVFSDDGCTSACRIARCGDGVTYGGVEACDDGNRIDVDACKSDCTLNVCGDGVRKSLADTDAEACDDGNDNPNDECNACGVTSWSARVVAGLGLDAGVATQIAFGQLTGIATTRTGTSFVADALLGRVYRIDPSLGRATVYAGTGQKTSAGDGLVAAEASFDAPRGIAVDGFGNVFVTDANGMKVRRIDAATQVVTTYAGTGVGGTTGDGGPATSARLQSARTLVVDGVGNLYITLGTGIRVVDALTGTITSLLPTTSGTAPPFVTPTPVGGAQVNVPVMALDGDAIYVCDSQNYLHVIEGGAIRTVANLEATCQGLVMHDGSLYAWLGTNTVRLDPLTGASSLIAVGPPIAGPLSSAPDSLRIATGRQVRSLSTTTGETRLLAGSGRDRQLGDGSLATGLTFGIATGVALSPTTIYVAEIEPDLASSRIRAIDRTTGVVTSVAGGGAKFSDTNPAAIRLGPYVSLAYADDAHLYLSDTTNDRVLRLDLTATTITPVVSVGDPSSIALRGTTLYISSTTNDQSLLRALDLTNGSLTVVAGNCTCNPQPCNGDGGPALAACLVRVEDIAVTTDGALLVADTGDDEGSSLLHNRVRSIDLTNGTITTIAGNGTRTAPWGDGGAPTAASFNNLGSLRAVGSEVILTELDAPRLRRFDRAGGTIATIAGSATGSTFAGDGGPIAGARFEQTRALDCSGTTCVLVELTGSVSSRLRQLDFATGTITTVGGEVDLSGHGPLATVTLPAPQGLVALSPTRMLVSSGTKGRLASVDLAAASALTIVGYPDGFTDAAPVSARYSRLLGYPVGMVYRPDDDSLFIAERTSHVIRRVAGVSSPSSAWTIATYAGTLGITGRTDGPAATATFNQPMGLALDLDTSRLFIADSRNDMVRVIDLTTNVTSLFAGTPGARGYFGDGVEATDALFANPQAVAVAGDGSVYIADTGNNRVRRVDRDGLVHTVLGTGEAGRAGATSMARAAAADQPRGLRFDTIGDLFVATRNAVYVVTAGDDGTVTGDDTLYVVYQPAPSGEAGEDDAFARTLIGCITDVLPEGDGANIHLVDGCSGVLVSLARGQRP